MMKLTLTREQIPMARETVAWLRSDAFWREVEMHRDTPGFSDWLHTDLVGAAENEDWADALEAAITEAEGGVSTACVGCGKAIDRAHYPAACSKCIKRMSLDPNPTPGQMWQRRSPSGDGERVRIEGMDGDEVCFSDAGSCMSASIEYFRVHYCEPTSILPEQGSRARVR